MGVSGGNQSGPALQQAGALTPELRCTLPELRRTLKAPPHPFELRRTISEIRRTLTDLFGLFRILKYYLTHHLKRPSLQHYSIHMYVCTFQ